MVTPEAIEAAARATSTLVVCRNGDLDTPAVLIDTGGRLITHRFPDWKALLGEIATKSCDIVRKLYDVREQRFISSIREVTPGSTYVYMRAHGERFQVMDYTQTVNLPLFGRKGMEAAEAAVAKSREKRTRKGKKVSVNGTARPRAADAGGDRGKPGSSDAVLSIRPPRRSHANHHSLQKMPQKSTASKLVSGADDRAAAARARRRKSVEARPPKPKYRRSEKQAAVVLQKHYRGLQGRRQAAAVAKVREEAEAATRDRKAARKRRTEERVARQQRLEAMAKPRMSSRDLPRLAADSKSRLLDGSHTLNRHKVLPAIEARSPDKSRSPHGGRRTGLPKSKSPRPRLGGPGGGQIRERKRKSAAGLGAVGGRREPRPFPTAKHKPSPLFVHGAHATPEHLLSSMMAANVVYYWLRTPVPATRKSWTRAWPEYEPLHYTHESVLALPSWADDEALVRAQKIEFNAVADGIDRRSHSGKYRLDRHGYPMNPTGRQGIKGRGLLGRFGPNHAADPIVTRWKRGPKGVPARDADGNNILEVVLIKRRDNGTWALPGGMALANDTLSLTLKREFGEEALDTMALADDERQRTQVAIDRFFRNGKVVYKGVVRDPRNTDCAWMETTAVLFHDDDGRATAKFSLRAGDDAGRVKWAEVTPDLNLYAGHTDFVVRAREIILENSIMMVPRKGNPNDIMRQNRRVNNFKRWQFLHGLFMAHRDVLAGQKDFPENVALRHFDLRYHESLSDPLKELMLRCVNPGLVVGHSVDGCVLHEESDFAMLQPFFTKVMADLHQCGRELHAHTHLGSGHDPARSKNSDFDLERLGVGPCLARMRLSRNLASYPLTTSMSRADRIGLEDAVTRGITKMMYDFPDLNGTYYSLTPGHPNGTDERTLEELRKANVLFEDLSLDHFAVESGQASDWPIGRGLWVSADKTLSIWVGEEDHVKVISWTRSRFVNKAHKLCRRTLDALEASLLKVGSLSITDRGAAGWIVDSDIGYVASRPRNCGTGMGASVKLFLPRLFDRTPELDTACHRSGVAHWRDDSPLSPLKGQVVIDVIQSMGVTEMQVVQKLYAAVDKLSTEEKRLRSMPSAADVEGGWSQDPSNGRAGLGSRQRIRDAKFKIPMTTQNERGFAEAIETVSTRIVRNAVRFGLLFAREAHPHEHQAATVIQSAYRGYAARKEADADRCRMQSPWNMEVIESIASGEELTTEQMASRIQANYERAMKTAAETATTKDWTSRPS